MKRKIFSIFFVLVLVLSFSLVTAAPVGAVEDSAVPDRTTAITATADRLVALQGTDGGWDWIVTDLTAHSGTYPSPANLFGVTALGLIDAYQITENTAYYDAAKLTADHLKTLSRATDSTVRIQTFDYRFLVEFSVLSGDPSYQAHALSEWNWVKANVASFYADENQETIYNFWLTSGGATPGFAAWQAADCGLAALALGDTDYASGMATVLAGHLGDIAEDDIYRFIGWGHALEFLNAVDSVAYASDISSLITNLTGSQNADGSWGNGENSEGYTQDAAYAIMGLAAVGEREVAEKGAAWLVANQGYGSIEGGWNNSTDDKEYSESDSEALQALASVPAPVTIVENGYYTIQSAIDSATDGDTIIVAAGTYNESLNINVLNLTLQSTDGADSTTIDAQGGDFRGVAIWIEGSLGDVTIDGFRVENWKNGGIIMTSYSGGVGTYPHILNNTVIAPLTSEFHGVSIQVSGDGATVIGNIVGVSDLASETWAACGICVAAATTRGESIEGVVIRDNYVNNGGRGIGIATSGEGEWAVNDTLIEGNTVEDCEIGIQLEENSQGTLVQNNTIRNNLEKGIQEYVEGGFIPSTEAHYNNIYGNSDYGARVYVKDDTDISGHVFDAAYNWWGDKTGPEHATLNTGAQGNAVSDNVLFSPWLYEPRENFISDAPCYAGSVVIATEASEVIPDSFAGGWNSFSTPATLDGSANTWGGLLALVAQVDGLSILRAQRFDPIEQEWDIMVMNDAVNEAYQNYQIKPGEGFFIQVKTKGSLPILCNNDATWPPMTNLLAGWNLVGLSNLVGMSVADALSGVDYSVVLSASPPNDKAWSFTLGKTVEMMLLGEAYWVAIGETGILFGFTTTPVAYDMTWDLNQ